MAETSLTYVRCIVVETKTEVPGLALIQLHDDLPPVHYVPLDDLIELTYEYEQPIGWQRLLGIVRSRRVASRAGGCRCGYRTHR